MTNAPIPNKYGRMSEFWTAISFLTGLKIYQEHRTKKKKNPAMAEFFVKDKEIFSKNILTEFTYYKPN